MGEQDYTSFMSSTRADCIDPQLALALEDICWNVSSPQYKYLWLRVAVTCLQNLTRDLNADGGPILRIGKPQSDKVPGDS